jgi:hypothetical protein
MSNNSHTSLLSNIKIDNQEKFDLLKITIVDASKVFDEAHLKIRGVFAKEVVEFINNVGFKRLYLYQELQEKDWVSATTEILKNIKTRSVFLYFEDHKLVAPIPMFKSVVKDFNVLKLDYLCYSFYRASVLHENNILPFYKEKTDNVIAVDIDAESISILGKVSPMYHTFSLVSLVSVKYFKSLLENENKNIKIFSKVGISLLSRVSHYPGYKKIVHKINTVLKHFNVISCIYDPSSPFNLEKIWWEFTFFDSKLKIGLTRSELFANYDDDNCAAGESLIKRGLYPFIDDKNTFPKEASGEFVSKTISLIHEQRFELLYHSTIGRIRKAPVVNVEVESGSVNLLVLDRKLVLLPGEQQSIYSNIGGVLIAEGDTVLKLRIYDEAF